VVATSSESQFKLQRDGDELVAAHGVAAYGVVCGERGHPHTMSLVESSADVVVVSFEWRHESNCGCLDRTLRVVVRPPAKVLFLTDPRDRALPELDTTTRDEAQPAQYLVADDPSWEHELQQSTGLHPPQALVDKANGALPLTVKSVEDTVE